MPNNKRQQTNHEQSLQNLKYSGDKQKMSMRTGTGDNQLNDSSSPFRAQRKSHHMLKPISPKKDLSNNNKSSRSKGQKHATSIRAYNPNSHDMSRLRTNSRNVSSSHITTNNTSLSPLTKKHKDEDLNDNSNNKRKGGAESRSNPKKQYNSCRQGSKSKHSLGILLGNSKNSNKEENPRQLQLDEKYIYEQLMSLKSEYRNLKNSYTQLLNEKKVHQQEYEQVIKECAQFKSACQKSKHQLVNVKRECFRLLEAEGHRNKKLEETLQQKQLMIGYLRSQLSKQNCSSFANPIINTSVGYPCSTLHSTTPIFRNDDYQRFDRALGQKISHHHTHNNTNNQLNLPTTNWIEQERSKFMLSTISENADTSYHKARNSSSMLSDDSLRFSKDPRSVQADSFHLQLNQSNIPTLEARSKDAVHGGLFKGIEGHVNVNCCTFELKPEQTVPPKLSHDENNCSKIVNLPKKMTLNRKKLEINTDETTNYATAGGSNAAGNKCCEVLPPNMTCENCHSVQTKQTKKKDCSTKRKKKQQQPEDDLSSRSIDKKIEVCLINSKTNRR